MGVNKKSMIAGLILGGSVLLSQEVRLRTPLAGGPIAGVEPSGQADFRARGAAGDMRLNVEIEDVNLPAGTQLDVFANGVLVGKITVSGPPVRGGEMELNTRDGQTAPQLKAGDTIIVRGADTGRPELSPQSPGLLAVSLGLSRVFSDDHEMLRQGMVLYDALYAWCREGRGETNGWPPV